MGTVHSSKATTTPQFLRYENSPPLRIAGLRQTLAGNPAQAIPAIWARIAAHIDTIAYGLCIASDKDNGCFDYLAGIAVGSTTSLPAEWVTVQLDAQRYAVFAHTDHVSMLQQTVGAIFSQWLPQSGQQVAPPAAGKLRFFERYGEGFNPQTGRGDIEVWLPLAD